jgi:chemotaxis protein CheC
MHPSVQPRQIDAIREIANIGAGHAATNLSTLTGLRVMISVPRIQWIEEDSAPPATGSGDRVVIEVPIVGIRGEAGELASLILSRDTALRMVALMLRRDPSEHRVLGALERSALNELGNIVCAAYVGVLGEFLGSGVMIGTPELVEAGSGTPIHRKIRGLMIETDFGLLGSSFEGLFILSHTDVSFATLLDALGLGAG